MAGDPVAMIALFEPRTFAAGRLPERLIAGAGGALLSFAAGGLLRDDAGGSAPLMALFPILMLVAMRWGIAAGSVTLALGVVSIWYVYVGPPFSFVTTAAQAAPLLIAGVIGALILVMCRTLDRTIRDLRATHAQASGLAQALTERSTELARLNGELERALLDQAQARQAIEFGESQFQVSFEYAAVGKVQAEPETGKIIRVNQAFCDMLGYTAGELIGTDGWRLTFADDVDDDRDAYQRVLCRDAPRYIREKRYIRRDGSLVWARVSLAIVRSPRDDRPLLAIAVVENIDDQHHYQVALEQAKADLERTLAERTDALRQRDLLLREVYHRVKNNLQVVDGLIMLQSRQIVDPGAKAQLQQTRDRIFALGLVHHQLMGSDDLRTFDVSPFLSQLVDNLAAASASQPIRIEVHSDPIKVDLDFAIPLGLVVTELVTNALKHAFAGRPGCVRIGLAQDRDGSLTLRLSDDGIGIAPLDDAVARPGLGMRIVAGLLGQMRGQMHREAGAGTSYRMTFAKRAAHDFAG
jgi:PAS domain S-box-containing protein